MTCQAFEQLNQTWGARYSNNKKWRTRYSNNKIKHDVLDI